MADLKAWIFAALLSIMFFVVWACVAQAAEVKLEWHKVENADGYKVYYGTQTGTYQTPIDVGAETTYSLQLNGGTYYFVVTAYNSYGESGYSDEVSCAILEKPQIITVSFSP